MIPHTYKILVLGKSSVSWKLCVTEYPHVRYVCETALDLNGRPEICRTPSFLVREAKLRKKDRKCRGPLLKNNDTVPEEIFKYMKDFVHIMQVGSAWGGKYK